RPSTSPLGYAVLARREAAGDRERGWHSQAVGRLYPPGVAHPQRTFIRCRVSGLLARREAAGNGKRGLYSQAVGRRHGARGIGAKQVDRRVSFESGTKRGLSEISDA